MDVKQKISRCVGQLMAQARALHPRESGREGNAAVALTPAEVDVLKFPRGQRK